MIVILVVYRELTKSLTRELASAVHTDRRKELKRLAAIAPLLLIPVPPSLSYNLIHPLLASFMLFLVT